jgi:hypothetical protein
MTTDAVMADPENGVQAVNGTPHNIPIVSDCVWCHQSIKDSVLGFGAIQMAAPTATGLTVPNLVKQGLLTNDPVMADLVIPGTPIEQAALAYLHANCSNCHNVSPGDPMSEQSPDPTKWQNFRIYAGTKTVAASNTYKTAVNQPTTDMTEFPFRVAGGSTMESAVWQAMQQRAIDPNAMYPRDQMPPVATDVIDDAGTATIVAWINSLPPHP